MAQWLSYFKKNTAQTVSIGSLSYDGHRVKLHINECAKCASGRRSARRARCRHSGACSFSLLDSYLLLFFYIFFGYLFLVTNYYYNVLIWLLKYLKNTFRIYFHWKSKFIIPQIKLSILVHLALGILFGRARPTLFFH